MITQKEQSVIKVPEERIGAISGKSGATAKMLEQKLGISLELERDGTVTMEGPSDKIFFGKDVIKAIGRGFPPETALFIIDKDYMFYLIDLGEVCNTENAIHRVKGRVIGTEGTIKKEIEVMADCYISVYGNTIGIIASPDSLTIAVEAVNMLINGAMHSSVLNFLSRKKEELTLSRLRGHKEIR